LTALAVVIVAHGDAPDLDAVRSQLEPDDELVVIDNNGPDNDGFAGGANRGAAATTAPLLFFLNPDAVPTAGCLDALRSAPESWAAWQALVTLPGGDVVNTSGNVAHWTGLGWAGALGEPVAAARDGEVGFASGAALVVRRSDWERVGGFDPAYFLYCEDLDLSLRLRLAGRGVGLVSAARVEHDYAFDKGAYKWFHLERNRWWTVLATYPAPLLALVLPALVALELPLLAIAARQGWLGPKLRAQAAVLRSLPAVLRRRKHVQALRAVSAATFAASLTVEMNSPNLAVPQVANRLQAAYWAFVVRLLSA
jgi:GT2 family glycosyltransferase